MLVGDTFTKFPVAKSLRRIYGTKSRSSCFFNNMAWVFVKCGCHFFSLIYIVVVRMSLYIFVVFLIHIFFICYCTSIPFYIYYHSCESEEPVPVTHIQLLNKEEDMMKEAYAQSVECEEPCEGRLSRTVLWEGEDETPSLYSTLSCRLNQLYCFSYGKVEPLTAIISAVIWLALIIYALS